MKDTPLSGIAVLLALPLFVFNLGFLTILPGVVASVALAIGLVLFLRLPNRAEPIDKRLLAACMAIALALVLLGGEGHLFYATPDWHIRDAVFADLVRQKWPVAYAQPTGPALLRAPLGLYLAPAVVGKVAGMVAAYVALIAQNATVIGLILYSLVRRELGRDRWIVLLVFVFFSGLDVIPWTISLLQGDNLGFFLEGWSYDIAYLSHVTQIVWAPHHSIAGWSFVIAYRCWRAGRLDVSALTIIFLLGVFWSPLPGIGALPFLAWACFRHLRNRQPITQNLVAPILCVAGVFPAVVYMMSDSSAVQRGWLVGQPSFAGHYLYFLAIEVFPFVLFLLLSQKNRDTAEDEDISVTNVDLAFVTILLMLFPLYSISISNDFTMRSSIPALALLALMVGHQVAAKVREGFVTQKWFVVVLVLGAVAPVVEIDRAIVSTAKPISDCNLLDAWATGAWSGSSLAAYLADERVFDAMPGFFRTPQTVIRAGEPPCTP